MSQNHHDTSPPKMKKNVSKKFMLDIFNIRNITLSWGEGGGGVCEILRNITGGGCVKLSDFCIIEYVDEPTKQRTSKNTCIMGLKIGNYMDEAMKLVKTEVYFQPYSIE